VGELEVYCQISHDITFAHVILYCQLTFGHLLLTFSQKNNDEGNSERDMDIYTRRLE